MLCSIDARALASYTYDALGRRVTAAIGGVTTRYYFDGRREIEERDAADARVRYHVNGGQYIDERVATYEDATGQFRYYLLSDNFSIAGAGNASGRVTRLDYSASGDFGGEPCNPCDCDCDGDIDSQDIGPFIDILTGEIEPCSDCAGDADCDGDVDIFDQDDFSDCITTQMYTPCIVSDPPAPGTFVLHGRPIDVLADGKVLLSFRARVYDPAHSRWLQRDPRGYRDGGNLYESFASNALRFTDPRGEGVLTWLFNGDYSQSDRAFLEGFGAGLRESTYGPLQDRAYERFLLLYELQLAGDPQFQTDADILAAGVIFALGDITPAGAIAEAGTGLSTGRFEAAGTGLTVDTRLVRAGLGAAETALLALGSTNVLGSKAVQALEVKVFSVSGGAVRLGVYSKGELVGLLEGQALGGRAAQSALALRLDVGIAEFAANSEAVAARVALEEFAAGRGLTPQFVRLRANEAIGEAGELAALAVLRESGELVINTQFRQGAVLRGFDSLSVLQTPEGLRVYLNEVKNVGDIVVPSRFSALGLNRRSTFNFNLRFAQQRVLEQVQDVVLGRAILDALQNRTFNIRLIGQPGIRISPATELRIQQTTGAQTVEILDALQP